MSDLLHAPAHLDLTWTRGLLEQAGRFETALTVDVSGVSRVDFRAAQALIVFAHHADNGPGTLRIVGRTPAFVDIFEDLGVLHLVEDCLDADPALSNP